MIIRTVFVDEVVDGIDDDVLMAPALSGKMVDVDDASRDKSSSRRRARLSMSSPSM